MTSQPRILGVAGGGLDDASWAKNAEVAKIGKRGEVKTAALLNKFATAEGGVTVLHDVMIPIPGFTANIDHVVVSGRTVHIIDAKVWRPAFYWTVLGRTRRGSERFAAADKQTMQMALDALGTYFAQRNVAVSFARPVVAVWPSSTRKKLNVSWLRIPGAKAMTGEAFEKYAIKQFTARGRFGIGGGSGTEASQDVVSALIPLLASSPSRRR